MCLLFGWTEYEYDVASVQFTDWALAIEGMKAQAAEDASNG